MVAAYVRLVEIVVPDTKRISPSLLVRQVRLHLVAEDNSGVPRDLQSIVVPMTISHLLAGVLSGSDL